MINPNKFANQKIQELGQTLFQGDQMAQQMSQQRLDQPLPPPGSYGDINPIMNKDSREARRQERKSIREANKGLRQSRRERARGVKEQGQENYSYDGYEKGRYDKKGDDIEYGKTPRYSKKNPPLNQNDPIIKPIIKDRTRKVKEVPVQRPPLNQNDPDKKMFLVNKKKTGTSKDTLFLPKDTYVSKNGYPEDHEVQTIAKKAAADGIYNYTNREKFYNFEDMEDGGKVKYKN
jgi:hypothetical protein